MFWIETGTMFFNDKVTASSGLLVPVFEIRLSNLLARKLQN
jgi:hypothetical protein